MVRRVNDDLVHAVSIAKGGAADGGEQTFRLADDQFKTLVDLLTPGYELALLYKDQAARQDSHEFLKTSETDHSKPISEQVATPDPEFKADDAI